MGELERNIRDDVGQPQGSASSADNRRQMDMFEDERQRASWRRHGAIARGVAKRGLVAFLAFAMAFGATPAQLWADGAEGIAEAVAQATTPSEGAQATDGAADTTAAAADANDSAAGGSSETGDTGSAAPDNVSDDASDDPAASDPASATPASEASDTTAETGDATAVASEPGVAKAASRAAATFSSNNGVSVGKSQSPSRWAGSNFTAFIQSNTTLYANVWTSSSKRASASGCTYQWLAADISNKSDADNSAFVPVEGQTGASIVLDDALRTQLNGKCLRVRITDASGNVIYGPTKGANNQKLTATNTIKAPVPTKTALDAKSYVLIQSSADDSSSYSSVKAEILNPGTTLWANAYDGEAVPNKRIAAQAGWTYQWLASDSRDAEDSAYQVIPGQTAQSLTITDDLASQLAGKYIRVKVVGDGQELYGPSSSFGTPASVGYNTPGPVAASDQIALGHIVLAYNGAEFGDDYENVPNANVGDTIKVAAYYLNYDTPTDLYGSDKVDFSWWVADSADGTFEQVATGDTFTVTKECANRYLKVVAKAKKGIPGSDSCETKAGRILPKGATTLDSVAFTNASKSAKDTGSTIEACAYKAVDYSSEPVTEGVTYTWRWSSVDPSSSAFDAKTDWHVVEGKTDSSFTIPDDYAKRWVSVSATAGDNTVEATTAVAVKAAGSHELFLTYLKKIVGDQSDDAKFVYKSGEKIGVTAFEKTSAGTKGAELTSDQLTYTWQIADSAQGPFTTLTDENAHRPSFVISQKYVGKYLKCIVDGGYNTDSASTRYAIAKGDDAKAYTLTSVNVASSGNLAQVGGTLTPTANYMATGDWGDYETALPEGSLVDYRWYLADDAEGTNAHELFGVDETTGAITLPPSAEGKYAYVVANAGNNDVKSTAWLVNSSDEKSLSVNVRVVGVSKHDVGQSYDLVDWVPSTSYNWSSTQKMSAWDIFAKVLDEAGYSYSTDGGVPYSVTNPDKSQTLAMENTASGYKYWRFDINGKAANSYATGYYPSDGDTLELVYEDPTGTVSTQVSATCSVVGTDAKGAQQTWAAAQSITLKKGSTAADLSEQLFKQTGLKADYDPNGSWGWALNSIRSPFDSGRTLAYDPTTEAYWQLFINGKSSMVGAGGYTLKAGDSVVWYYSKYNDPAPADQLSVSCTVIGQDASGARQTWAQPTTALVDEGTTAADLSEQIFKKSGIGAKTGESSFGWYLESLTSPFEKNVTLSSEKVDENTWKYWQFFVNGKPVDVGAGAYTLKASDEIAWVYGSDGTMPGQVSVSMEIIGKKDDKAQRWTDPSMQVFVEGTTIKDASAAYFDAVGVKSKMYDQFGYWGVHTLVSPLDGTELSGAWSFFVNGVPGSQLDSDYVLKSGDKIVWAYAAGDTVPNPDEVVVDPSASRPTDWKADWSGNSNAVVENVSTPTGALASSWTFDWKAYSGATYPNASEPIVVNGNVYLAVNKRLLKIDAESGKVLAESNLKTAIGYTTRPIYTNGLVIVPLDGGAVQALTADTLTTVWVTDPVSKTAQSNSQLTVDGNYLYVGTVDVDYGKGVYNNGHLTRINILTGAVSWQHVNADEGYYWTGATVGDGFILVPTSAGTVEMLSKSSGAVLGSVSVGAIVNSSCVLSADGSHAYLISRDGKLHVLAISDGSSRDADAASRISEERVVDLGLTGCACMPTLYGNKLIVGGEVSGGSALAIVDLDNDFATTLVSSADGSALPIGGIKGAPLVSAQADGTYVYFTVNYGATSDYVNYTSGGGVYRYKLGDAQATGAFSATGHNNYCDSPIACDAKGNLYYINDSGTLFKLNGGVKVSFETGEGSKVDFQTTADGKLVKPADPTREGYTFGGWYTDEACTEAYDFSTPVTADMTLYAKWTKNAVNPDGNGSSGSNGGSGSGTGAGTGAGTGSGSKGGAVAPGQKPVTKTTVSTKSGTKDNKSDKKDSDKSDKKDEKKSDKKDGKSDKASASTTTAKKSTEASAQESGLNPLAIVGIAAGVIGLALIAVFMLTKRGKGDGNAR